ncbi:MAG: YifB family Mg chelatase-like AAA ATPase [Bacteroidota bacterium]|nr:YifB family Mg chelatase-like AAA ATPase [Bacteroidota bacterium]
MYARLSSASVIGISAFVVEVETHLEQQLPAFTIVGLPDSAVRESRERVTAAIKSSGFSFPQRKITVNLAPADVRKEGAGFDLPIAVGILAAIGLIPQEQLDRTLIIGELALDGMLRPIHGALSIAIEAGQQGFRRLILPRANAEEAALAQALDVLAADSLGEVVAMLKGELLPEPVHVEPAKLFAQQRTHPQPDFADVKGQEAVKRALEVAAAGGHNVIMIGPPGSGKTMLARRLPGILPPLTLAEALETTRIHSVAGLLAPGQALVTERPFRAPHHTISDAALVGGGMSTIRAGEISLAHHGVLFLDELPEFARNVLEVLRQPLEERRITISRSKMTVEYPCNVMLVCSMNPCPCGNFGNPRHECTCTPQQIQRYMAKISGPLLDRIDIHIEVQPVDHRELSAARRGESSTVIQQRVTEARQRQLERFKGIPGVFKNADMGPREIERFCTLDTHARTLLEAAMRRLGLSARAYDRILKVARTIADLDHSDQITAAHISEAIQYRSLDRQFWNV